MSVDDDVYITAQFQKALGQEITVKVAYVDAEDTICVIVFPLSQEPILFYMGVGSDDDEYFFVSTNHKPIRFPLQA